MGKRNRILTAAKVALKPTELAQAAGGGRVVRGMIRLMILEGELEITSDRKFKRAMKRPSENR